MDSTTAWSIAILTLLIYIATKVSLHSRAIKTIFRRLRIIFKRLVKLERTVLEKETFLYNFIPCQRQCPISSRSTSSRKKSRAKRSSTNVYIEEKI